MKKFIPQSPDSFLKKEADMVLAKFGHLNAIVENVTANEEVIEVNTTNIASNADDIVDIYAIIAAIATNVYADNTAALGGGLVAGEIYSTVTGEVRIVI